MKLTEDQLSIAENIYISRVASLGSDGSLSKEDAIKQANGGAVAAITFAKIFTEKVEAHDKAQSQAKPEPEPQLTEPESEADDPFAEIE